MTWGRDASRPRDPQAESAQQRRLEDAVRALAHAAEARDPTAVAEVMSPVVEVVVDSGGEIDVRSHGTHGPRESADLLLQILSGLPGIFFVAREINGGPGILLRDESGVIGVLIAAMTRDAISQVWVILNPGKLRSFDIG
jgi:RNA polymerase sigma-70 factor (ECF subfamily)